MYLHIDIGKYRMGTKFKMANICVNLIIWKNAECPIKDLKKCYLFRNNNFFPTSLMKMILSSLNLVRKIGVCITSEENGESKLTSEENLFNNLLH
jgi:hypothetical protein